MGGVSQQNVGKAIREARKRAGLTQAALAEMLSVTSAAVGQWERGETYPSTGKLLKLSECLSNNDQDAEYLLGIFLDDDKILENINEQGNKQSHKVDLYRKVLDIHSDGSSRNIGPTVGAVKTALISLVDMLTEAGLFSKEMVADRFAAQSTLLGRCNYTLQAFALDEIADAVERHRPKNELLDLGSADMENLLDSLARKIEELEADCYVTRVALLQATKLVKDRQPLVAALKAASSRGEKQGDHIHKALNRLIARIEEVHES